MIGTECVHDDRGLVIEWLHVGLAQLGRGDGFNRYSALDGNFFEIHPTPYNEVNINNQKAHRQQPVFGMYLIDRCKYVRNTRQSLTSASCGDSLLFNIYAYHQLTPLEISKPVFLLRFDSYLPDRTAPAS